MNVTAEFFDREIKSSFDLLPGMVIRHKDGEKNERWAVTVATNDDATFVHLFPLYSNSGVAELLMHRDMTDWREWVIEDCRYI